MKQKLKQEIDQIENQEKTQENDKRSKESPEMSAEEADNLTEKYPFIIDETEGTGLNDYRSTDEPSSNSLAQNGSQEQLTENVSTREPQRIQVKQKVRADSLSQLQENQSQNKIRRFDDNKMDKKILQNDATSSTDKPIENKVNEESTEKNLPLAESQALESSAPNTTLKESPELSTNAPEMKTESTVALKQNNQEKFTQKPTANNQQPPVKKAPLNPIKQMVDFHFDIKNKTANFISNQLAPKIMDLPGHIVKSQNNAAKGVFGKMLGMSRRQAISIPMQDAEDINEIRAKFPPAEYQFDTVEHKVLEGTELGQGDSNGDQQQGDNEGNQEAMVL